MAKWWASSTIRWTGKFLIQTLRSLGTPLASISTLITFATIAVAVVAEWTTDWFSHDSRRILAVVMASLLVAALMEGGRSIRGRSSTVKWYRVLQPNDDAPTIDLELTMEDGSTASRVDAVWDDFRFVYRPWVPRQTATANRVTIVRYLPGDEATAARLDPVLEDPDEEIHPKHTFDATPLLVTWNFDSPRRQISYRVTFRRLRDDSEPITSIERVDAVQRG